jgi:hypothetical protein
MDSPGMSLFSDGIWHRWHLGLLDPDTDFPIRDFRGAAASGDGAVP